MTRISAQYALMGDQLFLQEDIAVNIEGGKIASVEELKGTEDSNTLLMPGLFNAHIHSADRPLRGKIEITNLETMVGPGGIKHTFLESLDRHRLARIINQTRNEAIKYGCLGWSDFREGDIEGLLPYPLSTADFVPFARPSAEKFAELPDYAQLGIRDVVAYTEEELAKLQQLYSSDRLVFIHVSEDMKLRRRWVDKFDQTDISWILHMIDIDAMIHVTHADEDDISLMKEKDVDAILCLGSNKLTRSGEPPLKELLEVEISVGLGTDNAMFGPLSLWQEMRHYSTWLDGPLSPKRLLQMATTEGAGICGREWGISQGNSNFLKLKIPKNIKKNELYNWLVTEADHTNIIRRFQPI